MTVWLNAKQIADNLGISLAALQRMARRRQFPELLHVSRGEYRVRQTDYEAWEQSRMTSSEMAREELAAEVERHAITARKLAECEANRAGALGLYGKIESEQFELRQELKAARADAESARRDGQEIAAGLHEKLHDLRAENERLAKQLGELLKAAEIACRQCREETDIDSLAAVVARINEAEQPKPAGGGA